jgi:hypothetical protein
MVGVTGDPLANQAWLRCDERKMGLASLADWLAKRRGLAFSFILHQGID